MELRQMRYFKTIVEEGTISKAATKLHMAQPPLSMSLKQLEEDLGTELLIRGRRQVKLTAAGEVFYKRCTQILELVELTCHEVRDSTKETLRIGITSSNNSLVRIPRILNFFKEHSFLDIEIKEGSTYEIIDLLQAHNIDIGLVRTPFNPQNLKVYYLIDEPMIAVGNRSFMDENMTSILDYKDVPLIIHKRYLTLITDYCMAHNYAPHVHVQSDDCRTSLFWATTSQGVAIVPKSALPLVYDQSLMQVELTDQELYTSVAVITRKDTTESQMMLNFISLFR